MLFVYHVPESPRVPESHVTESHVPESHVPESHVPKSNVSESNVPESNVPESNVPESNVPESRVSRPCLTFSHCPEGLRFDSSWELIIFSLSHARDKTKNILLYVSEECSANIHHSGRKLLESISSFTVNLCSSAKHDELCLGKNILCKLAGCTFNVQPANLHK